MTTGRNRVLAMAAIGGCSMLLAFSAHAAERKILIATFDDIVIDGDMQVTIETGKSPSANATGDRRLLDLLKMERVGSTLRIRMAEMANNDRGKPITEPLKITISNRHVRDILLRGNARLNINNVKQDSASKLSLLGSGDITIGTLSADRLEANIVGNGKLSIGGGSVRASKVTINGGAVFDAAGLTSRTLDLTHNGNANTAIAVQESAEISNSGSGSIKIGGSGTCFVRMPGQATISCAKRDDKKRN